MPLSDRPAHSPPDSVTTTGAEASDPSRDGAGGPARHSGPRLDTQVLEGVRRRDPAALAAFFDRYVDQVYGLAYRLLGERAAAEDMTQDVFLKVHRAAHQLDPTRDSTPWVVAITYNACRDLWRSRAHRAGRRTASLDDEELALESRLPAHGDEPEKDLLRGERERLVQEAIVKLPEPLRTAIVLHDYQGLSHQEIADLIGVNHAAARKRYSRALAALGRLLEGVLQ